MAEDDGRHIEVNLSADVAGYVAGMRRAYNEGGVVKGVGHMASIMLGPDECILRPPSVIDGGAICVRSGHPTAESICASPTGWIRHKDAT